MHDSSYNLCKRFVNEYLADSTNLSVADVGSFNVNGTYRSLFSQQHRYIGFDIVPGKNVTVVVHDPEKWRLGAANLHTYDVVISGQVLEHVKRPWKWIHNVVSLGKPGGLVWICAPNTWEFHEHPVDCWRVFPDGLRALMEDANLTILKCFQEGPDTVGIGRIPK